MLLPNEEAVEVAVGEAIVLACAGSADVAQAVAAASVYFGPTDDPRAPRPACRIFEVSQIVLGREVRTPVPQRQAWRVELLAVAPGPYSVTIKGEPYAYDAQPGDDAEAIATGVADAVEADPNATVALADEAVVIEALLEGVHLAVEVSDNLEAEVTRDRAYMQYGTAAERTYAFNFASAMSMTAPSPKQHASTYAKLLRARLWHPDVLARLRAAGIAPRRIAAGPTTLDELVDNATETRAVLEVVFSITAGASVQTPVMESASATTTLQE